uniref:Uncharacterized protein n=1 Tax=Arundo donax TaxID=35708 RepID=A0A0A9FMI3_ARUDO
MRRWNMRWTLVCFWRLAQDQS